MLEEIRALHARLDAMEQRHQASRRELDEMALLARPRGGARQNPAPIAHVTGQDGLVPALITALMTQQSGQVEMLRDELREARRANPIDNLSNMVAVLQSLGPEPESQLDRALSRMGPAVEQLSKVWLGKMAQGAARPAQPPADVRDRGARLA